MHAKEEGDSLSPYHKESGFVTRRVAGETIIVPVRGGVGDLDSIFTLNEVGSAVWDLIDGRKTLPDMVEDIAGRFEVAPARAEADIAEFLHVLESRQLIRPAPACG